MKENKLVKREEVAPKSLLELAIEKGAPIETLEKLIALKERHEANEARKAYHVAMAAFKADPPAIVKDKLVDFTSQKGRTTYKHAGLADVAARIGEALSKHGLSAAWRTEQGDGGKVTVTCEITHVLGHSEMTPLSAPPDTTGNKNSIQSIASTVTYLSRYTLLCLTGLAASDTDDDGRGSAGEAEVITKKQVSTLTQLVKDIGVAPEKFCKFMEVESLDKLPASEYQRAVTTLKEKGKKARGE